MLKQKIIITGSIFLVLVLVIFSGYALWKKVGQIEKEKAIQVVNNEDQANFSKTAIENLRADICPNDDNPFDASKIKNDKIAELLYLQKTAGNVMSDKEFADLRGYYFCSGFLKNDLELACDSNLVSKELAEQCKNGFNFSKMVIASLNGEKEKAEEICRTYLGESELCKYIGSFKEIKEKNICSNASENERPNCYAFFAGDDSLCNDSENKEECFLAAKFLNSMNEKKDIKCDDLVSMSPAGVYDIVCKLNLNNSQETCLGKLKSFLYGFCGN